MERLDSLSGSVTLASGGVAQTTQQSLTAKGMPAGRSVDKFYLKFALTLTRGLAASEHLGQAVSEILNRLVISHGRVNWNVRGNMIYLFDQIQRLTFNTMNPILGSAATEYVFYVPVDPSPVGPPFRKANTFRTEELQNCVFDMTLTCPFDLVNDVTDLSTTVELWASYRPVDPDQKPWVSIFRQQDTFQGNNITINDMVPALLIGLGESPTNFDLVTVESSGVRIARGADMTDLDARDYYYQNVQPVDGPEIIEGGNQYLRNVPQADGAAQNFHKLFDARNDPDAALPIVAAYNTIPATFGYAVKGFGI